MSIHIIRHGKRDLVAGLDCSLHDRLAEAKRAAKASVAFNIQTVEDGKYLLACAKESLPKSNKLMAAGAFIGRGFPNAVIAHDIDDADLTWVCAITQGLPVADGDQIVPRHEAARLVTQHVSHINGKVIGSMTGATMTLVDAIDQVEAAIQAKQIAAKQIQTLRLQTNGISIKQLMVAILLLAALAAVATTAMRYQSVLVDKQKREQLLREVAVREEERKAQEERRAAMVRDFERRVKEEQDKIAAGGMALQQWTECDRIRSELPFSRGGWLPQRLICDFDKGLATVDWAASMQQTSIEHREALPGVINPFDVETPPKSEFPLPKLETKAEVNRESMQAMRLQLSAWASRNLQSMVVSPHQRITIAPPAEIKDEPGIKTVVIGDKAEWNFTASGFAQRLMAGHAVQQFGHYSASLKTVAWSSLSKPEISVQVSGVLYANID